MSEVKGGDEARRGRPNLTRLEDHLRIPKKEVEPHHEEDKPLERYRRTSRARSRVPEEGGRIRSVSPAPSLGPLNENDHHSMTASSTSNLHHLRNCGDGDDDDDDADEALPQDIQEMWFPGGHAVSELSPSQLAYNIESGRRGITRALQLKLMSDRATGYRWGLVIS